MVNQWEEESLDCHVICNRINFMFIYYDWWIKLRSVGKVHISYLLRLRVNHQTHSVRWITHKNKHSTHLYCWWSLVLLVLAMKRSASFSRLREYSISISDFLRKKSWRSCRSWTLISVCCSRHFCCSTSWARISAHRQKKNISQYVDKS